MANTNFSSNKFVKYFREVSVVVIGVAITLFASYRLGINNEKRDMTLYLNTVKMELEENIKILDTARLKLQISVNYSQYLWTHDKDALDEDTIKEKFISVVYVADNYIFKTNGFEMFKNSGIMRLVKNKEILLSLWDVYSELNDLQLSSDWIAKIQWEYIKEDLASFEIINGKPYFGNIVAPMYRFYLLGITNGLLNMCERTIIKTEDLVDKLEKYCK